MKPPPISPFRILCLHGFTSNGAVHAFQSRKITSLLPSSQYEFLFPDGPHIVPDTDIKDAAWASYVAANSSAGHRAWWFARESNLTVPNNSFAKQHPEKGSGGGAGGGSYYGLEESVAYVGKLIEETGPVHAIWGFSQGACFAGMLMALLQSSSSSRRSLGLVVDGDANADAAVAQELRKLLPESQGVPMAGVFFSGFRARFQRYHGVYEGGIKTPTLHVMGENDVLVSEDRSQTMMEVCEGPEELRHMNGHNLPKGNEETGGVAAFLRRNLDVK